MAQHSKAWTSLAFVVQVPIARETICQVVGHAIPGTSTISIKANHWRRMLYFELALKCVVIDACAMPNCIA